jgi:hypothetical protein
MDAALRPEARLNGAVARKLTPEQAYHKDYGSPLFPAPGWKWELNSTTQRLIPAIGDEPSCYCEKQLYRWHPDQGHFSLVRDDDDDGDGGEDDDNLYEYDAERLLFKRVTIVYEHDAEKNQFVRVAK